MQDELSAVGAVVQVNAEPALEVFCDNDEALLSLSPRHRIR